MECPEWCLRRKLSAAHPTNHKNFLEKFYIAPCNNPSAASVYKTEAADFYYTPQRTMVSIILKKRGRLTAVNGGFLL